jgi:hypothetical protein
MNGLVKVGCTTRSIEGRIAELSAATGVPAPFKLEAGFKSKNAVADEARVHSALSEWRLRNNKEFFRCSVNDAIRVMSRVLGSQPEKQIDLLDMIDKIDLDSI